MKKLDMTEKEYYNKIIKDPFLKKMGKDHLELCNHSKFMHFVTPPVIESDDAVLLNFIRLVRLKPSRKSKYKFKATLNVGTGFDSASEIQLIYDNDSGMLEADEFAYILTALADQLKKVSK